MASKCPWIEHNLKIPLELETFLSDIITKSLSLTAPKVHRPMLSIAQDFSCAAVRAECKLPKHLLLSMTLWHIYRSEQLVTLIMEHFENYRHTLELETGLAKVIEKRQPLLSTRIVRAPESSFAFHSEFDNFVQLWIW